MFRPAIVTAAVAGSIGFSALAATAAPAAILLDVRFAPREVRQIEVGDFHFLPGQKAPVHTHAAPAYGYVSKGTILYQVEGQPARLLHAGDAFFEPVGPRILHFDNASASEEAIFTDFNPERTGDPFIVFPTPPSEAIDRRALPTTPVEAVSVGRVVASSRTLRPGEVDHPAAGVAPITGYIAAGTVDVRVSGTTTRVATGATFAIPAMAADAVIANASLAPARIVTFTLMR